MYFRFDPDKNPFTEVITAAHKIKEVLDAIEVPSFPKQAEPPEYIFTFPWVQNIPMNNPKNLAGDGQNRSRHEYLNLPALSVAVKEERKHVP